MRKITTLAVKAFLNNETFKRDNTKVVRSIVGTRMYLHGNLIAENRKGKIRINNCGWDTPTTKERLNGVLLAAGTGRYIYQKNFTWYWRLDEAFPHNQWVEVN